MDKKIAENGKNHHETTPPPQKHEEEEDEELAAAEVNIWKYVFGFTEMAVVKCAIELGIADILENNGGSMTLTELSSTINCPPSTLHRIMRFLVHRGIFKTGRQVTGGDVTAGKMTYSQTPLSRWLVTKRFGNGAWNSMASFILLESSPVMLAPWLRLSDRVVGKSRSAFEDAHGEDVWVYAADHPSHSQLINDAMACHARQAVSKIIKLCPGLFDGVSSIVDVGGGDGTTLSLLVEAFPWIHGINFDLPHVVANAISTSQHIEQVGGNMFESVPKADVVFLMWVLHDWGDEESVEILKKCKEAITKDSGKLIIVESVLEDIDHNNCNNQNNNEDEDHKLKDVGLMLDMVMMAHTTHGKERTLKEWDLLLKLAGFPHFNVYPLQSLPVSLIQAFPYSPGPLTTELLS